MKIKTFIGLVDFVDEQVNRFAESVEVLQIQTCPTGRESMMVTVIYKEGPKNGR